MKGVPKECKSRTTGCVFGTLGHCGQTKNPSNHQTNHGQGTPKCGCYVASLPMLRERPGCGGQRLALLWSKMSRPNMQHHFPGCAILPGSINPYLTAWAYELRMLFRNSLDLAHAQLNLPTHAVTICHKSVASLPAHRSWSDPESQQEGRLELVPRELYNQSGYGSTCRGPMRSNIVDGSWLFGVLNCWTFKNESAIALWILNICGLETLSHPRHWAPLSSCVAGVLAYRPVAPAGLDARTLTSTGAAFEILQLATHFG